jgi:hypothetical protein
MTVLFQGFEQQPYRDVIKLYVRQSVKIVYLDHQLQQTAVCSTWRVDRAEVVEDIVPARQPNLDDSRRNLREPKIHQSHVSLERNPPNGQ